MSSSAVCSFFFSAKNDKTFSRFNIMLYASLGDPECTDVEHIPFPRHKGDRLAAQSPENHARSRGAPPVSSATLGGRFCPCKLSTGRGFPPRAYKVPRRLKDWTDQIQLRHESVDAVDCGTSGSSRSNGLYSFSAGGLISNKRSPQPPPNSGNIPVNHGRAEEVLLDLTG